MRVIRARVIAMLSILVVTLGLVVTNVPGVHAATNPTITTVSPSSGVTLGGTQLTITGTDFEPGALVYIANTPATGVVVVSSTRIIATSPRSSTGAANVLVTNKDGGAVTLNSGFFYTDVSIVLSLTSIDTVTGPIRGGTRVNLIGTGFSGSTVLFGNTPAQSVLVQGPSSISLRTPPGLPGPVTVTVKNGDGTVATLPNAFTYDSSGLEVSSLSQLGGVAAGGVLLRIFGNGFAPNSRVSFGTIPATDVVVVNPTLIFVTTPVSTPGTVAVTVTTPSGASATLPSAFTFRATSTAAGLAISGLSPAGGSAVGGTVVTITGNGFSGGSSVFLAVCRRRISARLVFRRWSLERLRMLQVLSQ